MLLKLLLLVMLLPPEPSAYVAALLVGRPDIGPALARVCNRESRCEPVGVHKVDAHLSRRSWGGQVQLRHLDRKCQPYGRGRRWATRGAFGLNAAAHWQFMPRCYKPEWFDVPLVSAHVAARKYKARCLTKKRRAKWCPRRSKTRGFPHLAVTGPLHEA